MPTLTLPNGVTIAKEALAQRVTVDDLMLHCELQDGRIISVPTHWYPRLNNASEQERNDWTLFAGGIGIHWEQLDEDLLVSVLMAGCNEPDDETSDQFSDTAIVLEITNMTAESWPSIQPGWINYGTQVGTELVAEH